MPGGPSYIATNIYFKTFHWPAALTFQKCTKPFHVTFEMAKNHQICDLPGQVPAELKAHPQASPVDP